MTAHQTHDKLQLVFSFNNIRRRQEAGEKRALFARR